MKEGGTTLPLITEGSVDWCWPEIKLICIFTDLPQDRVPQRKKKMIYEKNVLFLFLFCFVVFCILYKANSS